VVLFVVVHTLVGAGGGKIMDAANILKLQPAWRLEAIGAAT
jgi:ATP-dependent Clp protease ATP-binding subunit ClpA